MSIDASNLSNYTLILFFLAVCTITASATGSAAPTAPGATAPLDTMASISWTASTGATSYNIYRGLTAGSEVKLSTSSPGTFFEDTGLNEGTTYFYEITAVNSGGESGKSTEVSVTTVPPTQATCTVTSGDSKIVLQWSASASATTYRVYRDTLGGPGGAVDFLASGTSFTDTGLVNGTTYYYVIVPINASGENHSGGNGGWATPVAASSSEAPAGAPAGVTVVAGNALNVLTWAPVSNASTYDVFRGPTATSQTLLKSGVTGLTYTDSGLANGTPDFYEVRADNGGHDSAFSSVVSATPYVPSTPSTVTATASSSLVVLKWTATGTSYAIYRGITAGSETLLDSGLTGSSYTDAGVTNGATYFYKLQALNQGGSSPLSAEVSAKPTGPAVQLWSGNVNYNLPGEPVQSCTVTISDINRPILAAMLRPEGNNMGAVCTKFNAINVAIDGFVGFNFGTPNVPIGLANVCVLDYRWPQLSGLRIQAVLNAIGQLFPAHPEIPNAPIILDGFSQGTDNVNLALANYYNPKTASLVTSPLANRALAVVQLSELDEHIVNPLTTMDTTPHLFLASGLSDGNSSLNQSLTDYTQIPQVTHDTLARGIATYQGGPLTVINNAGGGHGANADLLFISTWLESVMSQRIPATLPTSVPASLPSWQNSSAWVGTYNVSLSSVSPWGSTGNAGIQLTNNLVSARTTYTDSRPFTWLPSQSVANTWLLYSNTGLMTAFNPVITSPTSASVTLGNTFSYQITASNLPTSYNATGLPLGLTVNKTTGAITGLPVALGTTTISISATNAEGTANGSVALSVNPLSAETFSQWEALFGVTTSPTAMPENDGISNLMKYLCDINPSAPMSAASRAALPAVGMTTVNGIDYVTLTYRQYSLKTGITITLQTSANLSNWSPLNPPDLLQQVGTDAVTLDPIMEIGVKAVDSGNQFIRLTVTQP